MKRAEEVYREMLFQSMEKGRNSLTQMGLSKILGMSLSMVNLALKPLRRMNAVKIRQRGFSIIDRKKILYYWASVRNLEKDIIYKTRAEKPVRQIESEMPSSVIYTAYSGYKFMFKNVPADYSEVYVYADEDGKKEIEKRFPKRSGNENIFVLKRDSNMKKLTVAQLFVDLWNLKEWYARDFLKAKLMADL